MTPRTTESKREREKRTVAFMIGLYCKKQHGKGALCAECAEVARYAAERCNACPHMEEKTFCSNCPSPCYRPQMREKIREIMRFSGPRMMLYHPVMAVRHLVESKREKKRLESASTKEA